MAPTMLFVVFMAAVAAVRAEWEPDEHGRPVGRHMEHNPDLGLPPYLGQGSRRPDFRLRMGPNGEPVTGARDRPAAWHAAVQNVRIDSASVRVSQRPMPMAVQRLLFDDVIEPPLLGMVRGLPTNTQPPARRPTAAGGAGDRASHVLHEHRVHVQDITGTCGAVAVLAVTDSSTVLSLLFSGLNATTTGRWTSQLVNCAFRIPLAMPGGMSVAALQGQLRGSAFSSPLGRAGVSWGAAVGQDALTDQQWAQLWTHRNYEALVWSQGQVSGADFDPAQVSFGELVSMERPPTFSPCSNKTSSAAAAGSTAHSVIVPFDIHFILYAVRSQKEVRGSSAAQSAVWVDSLDGTRDVKVSVPLDFELC